MKRTLIPMNESDMKWVREYLAHDAATNHPELPFVDTWLVECDDEGDVEVFEVVSTNPHVDEFRAGFLMMEDMETVIRTLVNEGFPINQFEMKDSCYCEDTEDVFVQNHGSCPICHLM